jgi:hypothetical protein
MDLLGNPFSASFFSYFSQHCGQRHEQQHCHLCTELKLSCKFWSRKWQIIIRYPWPGGRDSVVGIVTRYGLDVPGIESRWRRGFPHSSIPAPGAHPASFTISTGSFSGVKAAGAWRWPPTRSSAEVMKD